VEQAQSRITAFIKAVPPVGRAQMETSNDLTFSVVAPDQYRPAIIEAVSADARRAAAAMGTDYAVQIEGLQAPVEWSRSGVTEVFLCMPYKLVTRPAARAIGIQHGRAMKALRKIEGARNQRGHKGGIGVARVHQHHIGLLATRVTKWPEADCHAPPATRRPAHGRPLHRLMRATGWRAHRYGPGPRHRATTRGLRADNAAPPAQPAPPARQG
jgi:hypothetical protein